MGRDLIRRTVAADAEEIGPATPDARLALAAELPHLVAAPPPHPRLELPNCV